MGQFFPIGRSRSFENRNFELTFVLNSYGLYMFRTIEFGNIPPTSKPQCPVLPSIYYPNWLNRDKTSMFGWLSTKLVQHMEITRNSTDLDSLGPGLFRTGLKIMCFLRIFQLCSWSCIQWMVGSGWMVNWALRLWFWWYIPKLNGLNIYKPQLFKTSLKVDQI